MCTITEMDRNKKNIYEMLFVSTLFKYDIFYSSIRNDFA